MGGEANADNENKEQPDDAQNGEGDDGLGARPPFEDDHGERMNSYCLPVKSVLLVKKLEYMGQTHQRPKDLGCLTLGR